MMRECGETANFPRRYDEFNIHKKGLHIGRRNITSTLKKKDGMITTNVEDKLKRRKEYVDRTTMMTEMKLVA